VSDYYNDEHKYDDIINLPHYVSRKRAHMSLHDRAAQFAPFAALTGHQESIQETARLTDDKIELDNGQIEKINELLYEISNNISQRRKVAVTYFKSDELKNGGSYLTDIGIVKKINSNEKYVIMESGMKIFMDNIVELEYV
jgi:hypothetical protein